MPPDNVLTATPANTGAIAPPVATVSPTATTVATAPIVALTQFGSDKCPFSSILFIGLLRQYIYIILI